MGCSFEKESRETVKVLCELAETEPVRACVVCAATKQQGASVKDGREGISSAPGARVGSGDDTMRGAAGK